jgi:thiol-disulfide isomerase/thioredoxin
MKKILTLKVLIFISLLQTQMRLTAQNYEELRKNYYQINEMAFRVKIIGFDPYKIKPVIDEKFYLLNIPEDVKEHSWINYSFRHVDTAFHHLSVYQPEKSMLIIADGSDTFAILYRLNKWDTIYTCQQNPPSNTYFTFSFPIVDCFYPDDIHKKKYNFKDLGDAFYISDHSPITKKKRRIWINKTNGLVDSIYEYRNGTINDKIYFEYYYTKTATVNKRFKPLPEFYPLDLFNPKILEIVNVKPAVRVMNSGDSAGVMDFLSQSKKLFLMDFWFIGCRPCHKNFPILEKLRKEYPDSILKIIAYDHIDSPAEIEYFRAKNKYRFDMHYDSLHLTRFYKIRVYPTTILINDKNEVLYFSEGIDIKMESVLREKLDALLKKRP